LTVMRALALYYQEQAISTRRSVDKIFAAGQARLCERSMYWPVMRMFSGTPVLLSSGALLLYL